jgi:hypothetical protein
MPRKTPVRSARVTRWLLTAVLGLVGTTFGFLFGLCFSLPSHNPIECWGFEELQAGSGAEFHIAVFGVEVFTRKGDRLKDFRTEEMICKCITPMIYTIAGFGAGAIVGVLLTPQKDTTDRVPTG